MNAAALRPWVGRDVNIFSVWPAHDPAEPAQRFLASGRLIAVDEVALFVKEVDSTPDGEYDSVISLVVVALVVLRQERPVSVPGSVTPIRPA